MMKLNQKSVIAIMVGVAFAGVAAMGGQYLRGQYKLKNSIVRLFEMSNNTFNQAVYKQQSGDAIQKGNFISPDKIHMEDARWQINHRRSIEDGHIYTYQMSEIGHRTGVLRQKVSYDFNTRTATQCISRGALTSLKPHELQYNPDDQRETCKSPLFNMMSAEDEDFIRNQACGHARRQSNAMFLKKYCAP